MTPLRKFELIYGEKSRDGERVGRRDYQGHRYTFRAVEYVHCLNYRDHFMDVCISKLTKLDSSNRCQLLHVNYDLKL